MAFRRGGKKVPEFPHHSFKYWEEEKGRGGENFLV